jgi:enoyl-CoA hydratase/carnithine racemase
MAIPTTAAASGLEVSAEGGRVQLTLNRPDRRNALSERLLSAMDEVLSQLATSPEARVIVIAAEGPTFCAGHDLSEMVGRSEDDYARIFSRCSRVMQQFRRLPQPVIARVQGPALAAGCQLVAACDLAVASERATFSTPGVKIGLFCTTPMVPLVRAIPAKAAMEMLLTGAPISAERALSLGLVNRVVPAESLDAAVDELAGPILAASPLTVRLGKAAFYEQWMLDESAAYRLATEVMVDNAGRRDAQEGISAFLQKRWPHWTGH